MAKQASSGSGDWTAGIVAIVAAMLLGGAIPIGLYYAMYVPSVQKRQAEERRFNELQTQSTLLIAREEKVRGLEADAVEMRARLDKVEKKFTAPVDRTELVTRIANMARGHNLRLRAEMSNTLRAKIVYEGSAELKFLKGLKASAIIVDCQATYHDFGRFLAEVEAMEDAVLIVESLDINGDQNGGWSHNFMMTLYMIEKRDIDAVGVN